MGETLRVDALLCGVRSYLCALPIEHVIEIMRPLPTERLGDAPEGVRGVAIVRGAPLPVVDVARLLGGEMPESEAPPATARFVAVRAGARTAVLAVDEVFGVRSLHPDAAHALPHVLRGATEAVGALGALDARLLVVLDAMRLVPDVSFGVEGPG